MHSHDSDPEPWTLPPGRRAGQPGPVAGPGYRVPSGRAVTQRQLTDLLGWHTVMLWPQAAHGDVQLDGMAATEYHGSRWLRGGQREMFANRESKPSLSLGRVLPDWRSNRRAVSPRALIGCLAALGHRIASVPLTSPRAQRVAD